MRSELIREPANVRAQQRRSQEERIQIEPQVPVVASAQVKVAGPRTSERGYAGCHAVNRGVRRGDQQAPDGQVQRIAAHDESLFPPADDLN
jgi:hypothetical protein